MKKLALLTFLLTIGLSYGQIKKKKNNFKKVVSATKTIHPKNKVGCVIAAPNSDSTSVISPTSYEPMSPKEDENIIYNIAGIEVKPDFPGGDKYLFSFISKNFQYTDEMKENELKGKIIASFIVEKDGSISAIKVTRSIGFGTEKEVIRVLNSMPKWAPGEQNGKKVRCSYVIPIMIYATK
ncbi:energy transducer TonB [Flavobacterium sp.]|uniref:energy transducer TonB n=1 Tax=Flavobacterium sp. TaxID=239 RepID=UPI003753BBCF